MKDKEYVEFLTEKYLESYIWVCDEVKKQTGEYPKKYKRFEKMRVIKYFNNIQHKGLNGFELITNMLSQLIVQHALPNTNHRSTLHFINRFLNVHNYDLNFNVGIQNNIFVDFIKGSKEILRQRKEDKNYAIKHIEYTEKWLEKVLGTQSGKLKSISAISLLTFSVAAFQRS